MEHHTTMYYAFAAIKSPKVLTPLHLLVIKALEKHERKQLRKARPVS